jgi:hypothetical protein
LEFQKKRIAMKASIGMTSESLAAPSDRLETLAAALFRPMGVDGVYARTPLYE